MFSATRRWFQRNRTPIAVCVGVVGAGYVATQYVLGKINDARERLSADRIAKENLRRRFEQNQEDCTFTVLALLPTATTNILEAMNTEKITYQIQQIKSGAGAKSSTAAGSLSPPSVSETAFTDDDGRSILSSQSDSGVHTSQIMVPSPAAALAQTSGTVTDAGKAAAERTEHTAHTARKTKRQLWDDLTISSITRAYTLIYTLALLTLLTRIQLNLLGRRSYLSSVVSLATGSAQAAISLENKDDDNQEQTYGSDFEANRKYLTFSWWLLNRGWVDIAQRVEAAVREVFGHLSPRDSLTFDSFSALTAQARQRVEHRDGAEAKWLSYLLPSSSMEEYVLRESGILGDSSSPTQSPPSSTPVSTTSLRRLLDETADLIESPTFAHVLTQLLDASFAYMLNIKLAQGAFDDTTPPPPPPPVGTVASIADQLQQDLERHGTLGTNRAILLPKILSVLTRQAHAIGNGMPNEYLREMESVRDLEAFAAVVYSSNWESEIVSSDDGHSGHPPAVPAAGGRGTGARESMISSLSAREDSLVIIDHTASFESAWDRAAGTSI